MDSQKVSPFGKVIKGMDVVSSIYDGYGETPNQQSIQMQGNAYLQKQFPNLDFIKTATIAADAK